MFDKIKKFLQKLAGSKAVAWFGGALVVAGTLCAQLNTEQMAFILWIPKVCAYIAIAGGLMALLGKGVADRRTDEERNTMRAELDLYKANEKLKAPTIK